MTPLLFFDFFKIVQTKIKLRFLEGFLVEEESFFQISSHNIIVF